MVSKASDDLPEPLSPVITTSLSRGISNVRFFKLCSRAPPSLIQSFAISTSELLAHINLQAYGRTALESKNVRSAGFSRGGITEGLLEAATSSATARAGERITVLDAASHTPKRGLSPPYIPVTGLHRRAAPAIPPLG